MAMMMTMRMTIWMTMKTTKIMTTMTATTMMTKTILEVFDVFFVLLLFYSNLYTCWSLN